MNKNTSLYGEIKLAILRALLGSINPSLRGVSFEIDSNKKFIMVYFFHDGQILPAIENYYSCIDCEASADFFYDNFLYDHDFKIVRIDYPEKLPKQNFWVYIRKEPFVDP